jgi:hypothetical protein
MRIQQGHIVHPYIKDLASQPHMPKVAAEHSMHKAQSWLYLCAPCLCDLPQAVVAAIQCCCAVVPEERSNAFQLLVLLENIPAQDLDVYLEASAAASEAALTSTDVKGNDSWQKVLELAAASPQPSTAFSSAARVVPPAGAVHHRRVRSAIMQCMRIFWQLL